MQARRVLSIVGAQTSLIEINILQG